jgi:quercetin dioxygenase-like cupin family protein
MRTFDFDLDRARRIDAFGSFFAMARLVHNEALHVGCMYINPRGGVGRHPTATYQLFAVVQGQGWTRTGDGEREPIESGQAVYWEPGEVHEAGTEHGMMVIVVEGNILRAASEEIGPVPRR